MGEGRRGTFFCCEADCGTLSGRSSGHGFGSDGISGCGVRGGVNGGRKLRMSWSFTWGWLLALFDSAPGSDLCFKIS